MADVVIRLLGDSENFKKALGDATSDTKKFGTNLTKILTPIAAGIAALGVLAFRDWHEAVVTLESQTGATGAALDDLKDSLGDVGKQAPESLAEIAEVMADLSAKTELTGDPLETLTDQFLDLERMGMGATVDTVADAFRRWGVESEDLSGTLDMFFRAAQESGGSVDDMAESLTKFAPALEGFGLTLPEATALLASFEAEGVPAAKAMGGLTTAFGNFAKQGKDPQKALDIAIEKIKEFKDPADAAAYAIEIFGKRAGPELAKAIRDGSFDLDKMLGLLEDSKGKIDTTADSQQTLNDKFLMFKNRVFDALGPYGEMIGLVGGGVAAIGPSIVLIAELATAYKALKAALQAATFWQLLMNAAALLNPYVLIAALILAVGVAVVIAYKKFEKFRAVVDAVIGFVREHWQLLLVGMTGGLSVIIPKIVAHWGTIKGKAQAVISWVKGAWNTMTEALKTAFRGVASTVGDIWDTIKGAFVQAINWIVDRLNSFIGKANAAIGKLNAIPGVDIPSVPTISGVSGGGGRVGDPGSGGDTGSGRRSSSGGGGVTLVINSTFPPTEQQVQTFAEAAARGFRSQGYRPAPRIAPGI